MRYEDAVRDLDSRQSESMPEPGLDRIRAVSDLLDHPELTYPTVHITGTNGKSTTARLVMRVACAHGLVTGTFLSPHVDSLTERLSVCGESITEEDFGEEYGHLLPFLERVDAMGHRVTYFETLTAMAYLLFADKPVQLGVFEVGMGGVWDATNLIRGEVAVLCPIGLDHMAQLGPSIRDIAREKAGIIKEGSIAVVREQRLEAHEVIEARCREVGAPLLLEGRDFELAEREQAVGGQALAIRGLHGEYRDLFLPMHGEHVARNAAAAVVAVEALIGRAVDQDSVRAALAGASSSGRIEVVGRRPLVILDGAHNPDAMQALAQTLPESFRWRHLHLVMAMFADKEVEEVVDLIAPLADRGYAAANSSPRSAAAARVADALTSSGVVDVGVYGSLREAVEAARAAAHEDDVIVVTGSFYTVADVRRLFVDG